MQLPARPVSEMSILRQVLSFGMVGVFATLTHVFLTWLFIDAGWITPYTANLLGTGAAFSISFFGNASLTFRTDRGFWQCAQRYLLVSLFSFAMTSAILALVEHMGLPTYIYVLGVLATIPPMTFLFAKFWAFRSVDRIESGYGQLRKLQAPAISVVEGFPTPPSPPAP